MPPQLNRIQLIQDELYMERVQGVQFVKTWSGDIIYFTSNALKSHTNVLEETLPDGTIKWLNLSGQEIKLNSGVLLRSTELPQHKSPVENFYDGLQRFQSHGKFGFRDQQGRLIIPNRYDSAQHFSEGLAAFKLLGKWGFLDVQDKIVINPSFERVDPFSQGYARVYNKGKYGLIDKKGQLQLSLQYDSIQRVHDYWVIYQNKLVGLATQNGRVVIQPRYQSIQLLPNQQVLVELNDKLGVITIEGLSIVPVAYHELHFDANKQVFLAYELPKWISLN